MSLFRKKSLDHMLIQVADSEKGLKRTLGAGNLIALGIGAIIGAGLFVRTAAAAGQAAGPAVTISFIIAAIGCAFAGLCYAEFASMIPIAGSWEGLFRMNGAIHHLKVSLTLPVSITPVY